MLRPHERELAMKVLVQGDVGRFQGGQTLTLEADVADYLRTLTDMGRNDPIKLSDAGILACADRVHGADDGGGDDWETAVIELIESGGVQGVEEPEGSNVPPVDVSISDKASNAAFEAAKADDDDELQ